MKIIFIDSDILLDTVLIRQPHFSNSFDVVALANTENFNCFTSVHSLLNIHYLTKKIFGEKSARKTIEVLSKQLIVVREDLHLIEQALISNFPISKMRFNIMQPKVPMLNILLHAI